MKILFLYLTGFSGTGGIEKFNKAFLKALGEVCGQPSSVLGSRSSVSGHPSSVVVKAFSLYDDKPDHRYINNDWFRGFKGNKLKFVIESIKEAIKSDLVILGHINLSPVGMVIKKLRIKSKIFLITHGIDVWKGLTNAKKSMLLNSDEIISVSNFTKQKLINIHKIPSGKIKILPDTLDPYLKMTADEKKPEYLMERYNIRNDGKVILTVSRLSSQEKYKGYDKVIQSLPEVIKKLTLRTCREDSASSQLPNLSSSVVHSPFHRFTSRSPSPLKGEGKGEGESLQIKYIIVGKADNDELNRIKVLIKKLRLEDYVILTGYVPDAELIDHYLLSDIFVMPSKGEGFGIVFLEALACGKPVIAGNKDASVEAVLNGELGILVDPDDIPWISQAIIEVLEGKVNRNLLNGEFLRKRVIDEYGFDRFKERVKNVLRVQSNEQS